MKLNKIGFPVLFLVSASAFASPKLFTQTFDLSGVHYTLRFTADDASPAVVTALADSVRLAQQRALEAVKQTHFDGAIWRNDIGHRAIRH